MSCMGTGKRVSEKEERFSGTFEGIFDAAQDPISKAAANGFKHIGILGGTFDPIHMGHLTCAEAALNETDLDMVYLMPNARPSFKGGKTFAAVEDRLEMARLAISGNDRLAVSSIEAHRRGITYTADTARELSGTILPSVDISLIIGSDSYLTFPLWRESDFIASCFKLLVIMRPGDDIEAVRALTQAHGNYHVDVIDCPLVDISSSLLRDMVARGKSIRYLTEGNVCEYIKDKGLYKGID